MRLLNDTLKNAITIGSAHSYLEICNLLDTKEKELRIIAADMIQAEQKLFEYNKESVHERNLYLPVSNTMTHMITTLGKVQTNGITSSTANDTANSQSTVNAANAYKFKGECYNCGRTGHSSANCYKTQFEKFTDRNRSRNLNQPRDFRQRSNSNDRDRDRYYNHDRHQDRERGRECDRDNDRDRDRSRSRYDQSPSPYPRDRSRSRERTYYEPQNQNYREKHNNSVANTTVLREQQEVPTAQNAFRTPPEWELLERQEEENKRNEQSRQLTDNSRNRNNDSRTNDNTNYDTRAVRDSKRVTYANRP